MSRSQPKPLRRWSRPGLVALVALTFAAACGGPVLKRVRPDIVVEEKALDFGKLPILNVRTLPVTVINQGAAPLKFEAIDFEGADADIFFVDGPFPDDVAVGSETELLIAFRPTEETNYTGQMIIRTNDPDEPDVTVELEGIGDTIAAIEVEPREIHFGIVGEGTIAIEPFVIRSVGTAPLIVESIGFADGSGPGFQPVGAWTTGSIEVGKEIPLQVAFRPLKDESILTGQIEIVSTDPLNRTITVDLASDINRAPLAICSEDIRSAPGETVSFDGSASNDPDGHEPITYQWSVTRRPFNSNTPLVDDETATPSLELDVPGDWVVNLCVTDQLEVESVECCNVNVKSVPAEKLYVELVWDHPQTDLDLHFIEAGGSVASAQDCWWGNTTPDFGEQGLATDDPFLRTDDLAGFGPEVVTYKDPAAGSYQVFVDFAKDNGAGNPATNATIRVYQFGVLVSEITRRLGAAGAAWNVLTVDWPTGDITVVDRVTQ